MNRIFKAIFFIVLIFLISFSVVFFLIDPSSVNAFFSNTFVASSQNISSIDQSLNSSSQTLIPRTKFDDFTESTIDKEGFYLRIDKIGLFKQIIQDVDPRYKDVYVQSWNYGISHGKFTSTPDKIGITYLFAHALGNKDIAEANNAWFSNMDQLEKNDEIIIYYKGIKYIYEVSSILAVSPKATGFYTGASSIPMVRMQYCGPPTGSLDSRTLVDALLVNQVHI